ncbi:MULTISPECIES: nuclear transport factor 2 family protein [Polymorphospora]|uniref:Nuclear transport factor 2 family protein n=1 Tax=Polymorphospora lycopeni TaxID=3140240 RepID=A0ABV5CIX2_9ACTN
MGTEDPAGLIDRYLQLCEDRELTEAGRLLAPGALIVFPGGRVFGSLTEMAAAATGRYRWVRKHRDRYLVGTEGDRICVTSLGTLYGEGNDGEPFDRIRYADVFLLQDGLITEQHVYNDLAVERPAIADPDS